MGDGRGVEAEVGVPMGGEGVEACEEGEVLGGGDEETTLRV